jgi:hypothetical protein
MYSHLQQQMLSTHYLIHPAILDPVSETYIVDCNVKAPQLGVKISSEIFYHNGDELVILINESLCVSSLVSNIGFNLGAVGIVNILGDLF